MAYHFSANQFDDQYSPRKLGNWEYPKWYPERPRQRTKLTEIIADDNGRLLDGIKRENPWGNYVGTWDLPRRITRDYVNKLVAPPERLVKLWGKKKRESETQQPQPEPTPQEETQAKEEKQKEKTEGKRCRMCGKLISECNCDKSCHSEEVETCSETLYCAKCNQELCLCEDNCRCPPN